METTMTDTEFGEYLSEEYLNMVEQTIVKTVEYLRTVEKDNPGHGYATLDDLHEKGIVKQNLYESFKETLDKPTLDFTIEQINTKKDD